MEELFKQIHFKIYQGSYLSRSTKWIMNFIKKFASYNKCFFCERGKPRESKNKIKNRGWISIFLREQWKITIWKRQGETF